MPICLAISTNGTEESLLRTSIILRLISSRRLSLSNLYMYQSYDYTRLNSFFSIIPRAGYEVKNNHTDDGSIIRNNLADIVSSALDRKFFFFILETVSPSK